MNDTENAAHPNNGVVSDLKKQILTHATTWINLEDIVLSERSQTQKNKYSRRSLEESGPKTESRWWAPGAGEGAGAGV